MDIKITLTDATTVTASGIQEVKEEGSCLNFYSQLGVPAASVKLTLFSHYEQAPPAV